MTLEEYIAAHPELPPLHIVELAPDPMHSELHGRYLRVLGHDLYPEPAGWEVSAREEQLASFVGASLAATWARLGAAMGLGSVVAGPPHP